MKLSLRKIDKSMVNHYPIMRVLVTTKYFVGNPFYNGAEEIMEAYNL